MSTATHSRTVTLGVGIDTARYGHHATFLQEDRQPAIKPLEFLESRLGYQQLQDAFSKLAKKHENVHFHIRVDAAGQYATNLLEFLQRLTWPKTISVGEPARNKRYRQVHFPKRKADATESHACARFAVVERPDATPPTPPEMLALREVASRLEFQVKGTTRQINRLHNVLTRVFPEMATLQNDLATGWVLKLLEKYPTAERIAKARLTSLTAIPYVNETKAIEIREAAAQSVAAERGEIVEELVRQSVRDLQQSLKAESALEKLLLKAFRALPDERIKQIETIKGIGTRTAAVLVAKIVCIERFPSASHLVSYFGIFPEENSSGVDKYGKPVPEGTKHMSRKGNDLVRKHLWMAAFVAIRHNPQVKALYARLRARGRRGDVALGHCMRKLLNQVFGIWTTGRPYDPNYGMAEEGVASSPADQATTAEESATKQEEAAGRKTGISPQRKTVTATSSTIDSTPETVNQVETPTDFSSSVNDTPSHGSIDFPYLRSQITLERVLRHLGYFDRLRGGGHQRRGPCPVHGTKRSRGRTFSVHLGKNVHQCFHPPCGASGNVIDLWAQIHQLTTYEGAVHLAETFDLELYPGQKEKRNP
jgi:transposase